MIFVTVGTHEQQFNRLIKCIDNMVETGKIKEKVIIQSGYSDYIPKFCESQNIISYDEMQRYIRDARIIVTHGGPSSFIFPLSIGKIPIVVPRKKEYCEHVNNHQVHFLNQLSGKLNIIVAQTDEEIEDAILNYDKKTKKIPNKIKSNNKQFVKNLEREINSIL